MEEKQDNYSNRQWYDSILKITVGTGALTASFVFGVGLARTLSPSAYENGLEKELREVNIMGKEISEKFYLIDGKLEVYEIDGRPVAEYFNKAER